MKPFLMGSETEYAVSGRHGRNVLPAEAVFDRLHEAMCQERRWVQDAYAVKSVYLEHGGRFYLDAGGHPEYATPECSTPWQVAAYDKAGERLMNLARRSAERSRAGLRICVTKNNIGVVHPEQVTWGSHESYTCYVPLEKAAECLVPHLVSRLVYAGSGCLSSDPRGVGFELSQRARHLTRVLGAETTHDRAIFCTRIRKANDSSAAGWVRAHLVGKDSQRRPFGVYLTFGVTGLLFHLVNHGRKVGKGLKLRDPLEAVRAISRDPWQQARVELVDGRFLTALEIQQCYLAECEKALPRGDWPDWAPDVVRHWRETLETLAKDPLLLADRLDTASKLFINSHELRRAGYSWSDLRIALQLLSNLRQQYPAGVLQAVVAENPEVAPAAVRDRFAEAAAEVARHGPGTLDRLRFAVRLTALDLRFHELEGPFDRLLAAEPTPASMPSQADIDRASREPPPGGRAALRSEHIRATSEPEWIADWRFLLHPPTSRFVDLRDPFAATARTISLDSTEGAGADVDGAIRALLDPASPAALLRMLRTVEPPRLEPLARQS